MKKKTHFFDSPAKTIVSIICIIPLLAIFIAGVAFIVNMIVKKASIGAESARNYAFADAGIQSSDAHSVHTEFEFEDGHFVYEVSFFANNMEYEYVVKASDGTILEREPYRNVQNVTTGTETTAASETPNGTSTQATTGTEADNSQITTDSAKQIALNHAGLSASDVIFTKAELEQEGLQIIYDIEFRTGTTEYEYEIHAETGKILKYDVDFDD